MSSSTSTVTRSKGLSWRTLQAMKGSTFALPFVGGFIFFVFIPIGIALVESLYAEKKSGLGLGKATRSFVGFDNIAQALQDTTFWTGLGRVAVYAIIVVPLTQGLSMLMALLIDAASRKTANRFRVLLLLPYMTPGIVSTIIWIYLYSPATSPFKGLGVNFFDSNMVWVSMGQMAIWAGLGFNMLIQYGSLQSIPGEIIEAARLDGASELRIAWSIKIPYMISAVSLTTMFNIIGVLQLFNEPYFFRSISPQTITKDFTPAMQIYNEAFQAGNLNYATALSLVLAVILGLASACVYAIQNKVDK
ncbi:carbohydrate ABC transporter permease [Bifidobacterium oedipodis]|uniref:Transporter n=1 Tax=Bifidobacterium oedipodis TaxID=2675322 RepID=A0A7Y0HSK3_9BIFI|nr:sugar ABC transporter permease [Bifidobacterium sp. DSM 109957]NMM94111.1 transporter [Bifidobacterium sp. DSM 109957]